MTTSDTSARAELRRLRRLAGLSVTDLAKRLRVSPASVSGWETGNRNPSPRMIHALADELGITTEAALNIVDHEVTAGAA